MKTKIKKTEKDSEAANHRGKVKSDFPKHSLVDALRVPKALADKNGGQPLPPTETAIALGMSPGSSDFRILLSSSIKYGLTSGSYNQDRVTLEELGRNIVEPRNSEDEHRSLVQAALNPPTFSAIYKYFKGKKIPEDLFFQNTLVREFQVPRDHAAKCASVFTKNMNHVGLIRTASTGQWLSTETAGASVDDGEKGDSRTAQDDQVSTENDKPTEDDETRGTHSESRSDVKDLQDHRLARVFITHGKNKAFIGPIKDLLNFGQLEPVVSIERGSVAQPIPDKVMNDMRTCGAAIIHVEDEETLMDQAAEKHVVLNPNVLIEIGAAMALYGRRFILLVKDGIKLPSNLQGLSEVRYTGDKLDGEVTISLLKSINEIKNHGLPAVA